MRRAFSTAALLAAPASALASPPAGAAASTPGADLAYLRLLVAAELLKLDFGGRALASGRLPTETANLLRQMAADDASHLRGLTAALAGAAATAPTAAEIDFSYPRGTFASRAAIARRAWKLGTLALGAYLGAVESVATPALRRALGQIAANEAQQLSALAPLVGRPRIGGAFAASLSIAAASAALDEYES